MDPDDDVNIAMSRQRIEATNQVIGGGFVSAHRTFCESICMTAEMFEGHCTDLPAQKKK